MLAHGTSRSSSTRGRRRSRPRSCGPARTGWRGARPVAEVGVRGAATRSPRATTTLLLAEMLGRPRVPAEDRAEGVRGGRCGRWWSNAAAGDLVRGRRQLVDPAGRRTAPADAARQRADVPGRGRRGRDGDGHARAARARAAGLPDALPRPRARPRSPARCRRLGDLRGGARARSRAATRCRGRGATSVGGCNTRRRWSAPDRVVLDIDPGPPYAAGNRG